MTIAIVAGYGFHRTKAHLGISQPKEFWHEFFSLVTFRIP